MRRGQVRMRKPTSQKTNGTPPPASVPAIPDKLYFRIGDVAKLCGVEAYVLRFWESEFPQLKPNKSGTGQRLYRRRDVELALRIKQLLYADGYTIAGARQVFAAEGREAKKLTKSDLPVARANSQPPVQSSPMSAEPLQKLRTELREILGMLSVPVKPGKHETTSRTRLRNENRNGLTLFDT
ncbi:MAG TPA: MerR family transcriptional regulator [Terracidiphilus sp.]